MQQVKDKCYTYRGCAFDPPDVTQLPHDSTDFASSPNSTAVICGAVFGTLAAAILIALLCWLLFRKRTRKAEAKLARSSKEAANDEPADVEDAYEN